MLSWITDLINAFLDWFTKPSGTPTTPSISQDSAITASQPSNATQESLTPKYDWSTPDAAKHSLRLICDEEGLSVFQKDTMSQVVHCESGYKTNIVHPNKRPSGAVTSTDYGICQWNDFFHGKEITPDEALHDPEKAVRLMCQYVKAGRISQWVCYSAGLYKNYEA